MTEAELLIKIRTALEAGGIDAAKTKIDELTKTVDANKASNTNMAAGNQKAVQGFNHLRAAANGNIGALGGLVAGVGKLGAALTPLLLIVGALKVGWDRGIGIQERLWANIVDSVDKGTGSLRKNREEFDKINDVKFDKVSAEVKRLTSDLDKMASVFDKTLQREEALRNAELAKKIADLERTMPEGPERDKAIATARFQAEQNQERNRELLAEQEAFALADGVEELKKAIAELESSMAEKEGAFSIAQDNLRDRPSAGTIDVVKTTRADRDSFKEDYDAKMPELQENLRRLNDQLADAQTKREVAQITRATSESSYKGTTASIDKRENDRQQKEEDKAFQEAQLASAQKQKEEAERAGAARIAELENRLRQAEADAKEKRRAADAYTPTAGARGPAKEKMEARDQALERAAIEGAAIQSSIADTLSQSTEALRRTLEALNDQIKMVKEQGRNATS